MDGLTPICPYCKNFSEEVTGDIIYAHRRDLHSKKFFQCKLCDAYVGTHLGTGQPLGTLANKRLRKLRSLVHASFDMIWQQEGIPRTVAYEMLAEAMNIPIENCHIAMFDELQCKQAVDVINSREIFKHAPVTSTGRKNRTKNKS